jgi:glutaconyl-CoA decarboxylase
VKRYRVTIDGRIYDVEIDDPNARPVTARLSGAAYSVDVEPERVGDTSPGRGSDTDGPGSGREAAPPTAPVASAGGPLADGPRAMTAPIPGVVAAVMASAGQTIERGDDLLTLDAMKMLNVIRSPWDGTIATVHVEPGDRVVQGEPLVTFVPT